MSSESETPKTFTQDQLNAVLAEERKKFESNSKKLHDELEAIKGKSQLSAQERSELEQRIESLKKETMTKEELAAQRNAQLEKASKAERDQLLQQRDHWEKQYKEATISRAILDAATTEKAYNPNQLVALLSFNTKLTEVLDDSGKPTGQYVPKTTIPVKDSKGKVTPMDLPVNEAIKKLKEQEEYHNLFLGSGVGGVGANNQGGGRNGAMENMTGEEYLAARAAGKLPTSPKKR